MPGHSVSLIAGLLLAFSSLAAAAEEFSVERLADHVFAIVRNDPPGFAVAVHATLFDAYVAGPAVTNVWNIH